MESEKVKMISGKSYKPIDDEHYNERQYARTLIFYFNSYPPNEIDKRNIVLRRLLSNTKNSLFIEQPFRCDFGYNIEIGVNFYSNYNLVILDCAKVKIGNNVVIGPNVSIYTVGHALHYEKRNQGYQYAFPISIGNNVWIGGNVVINPGITIGNNSVIGSGSVVTKDIPNDVIAIGNPCRVSRAITEEDKLYYYKDLKFD